MLASYFIADGVDAVRHPESHVAKFQRVQPFLEKAGLPPVLSADAKMLTRVSGAASAIAGLCLATGRKPRVAALALAALNVPLTVVNNPVWAAEDKEDRKEKVRGILRGLALGGGLILAATDRGGKPSLSWRREINAAHRAELKEQKATLQAKYGA